MSSMAVRGRSCISHTNRAVTEWEEKAPEILMLMPPEGFQHHTELAAASERGWLPAALLELPVAPVLAPRPGAGGAGLGWSRNAEGGWSSLPEPAGTLPHQ